MCYFFAGNVGRVSGLKKRKRKKNTIFEENRTWHRKGPKSSQPPAILPGVDSVKAVFEATLRQGSRVSSSPGIQDRFNLREIQMHDPGDLFGVGSGLFF